MRTAEVLATKRAVTQRAAKAEILAAKAVTKRAAKEEILAAKAELMAKEEMLEAKEELMAKEELLEAKAASPPAVRLHKKIGTTR